MKPATLACLALLLLVPGAALPRSLEAQRPAAQTQKGAPTANPAQGTDVAGQLPRTGERKRRTSYARCNRVSHERNLRGGVRRRFMIRCRLGYEKPRQQQQAAPPAQAPASAPAQPQQAPPSQAAPPAAQPPATSSQAQPAPPPAKRP